jgi:hypothetical protein
MKAVNVIDTFMTWTRFVPGARIRMSGQERLYAGNGIPLKIKKPMI